MLAWIAHMISGMNTRYIYLGKKYLFFVMPPPKKLLIFGIGTLGEIAGFYFQSDTNYEVVAFVDHSEFVKTRTSILNKPVIDWDTAKEQFPPADVNLFVAIGYRKTNSIRQARFEEVRAAGYRCASYISSKAINFSVSIGENCFILENNVLQPYTCIGDNVTMWSGNHLGHHSIVENNCFITSHVVISGKCRIGANSFLGVNCCLHDGVTIGEKSVIGAGSIVAVSCDSHSVFVPQKTEPRRITRNVI